MRYFKKSVRSLLGLANDDDDDDDENISDKKIFRVTSNISTDDDDDDFDFYYYYYAANPTLRDLVNPGISQGETAGQAKKEKLFERDGFCGQSLKASVQVQSVV